MKFFFSYKYNKNKAGLRLHYLASILKHRRLSDLSFHDLINNLYYYHFSDIYIKRQTSIITKTIREFNWNEIKNPFLSVYDIGSGEGFIYKTLSETNLEFSKFYNCDPYQDEFFESKKVINLKINIKNTIPKIQEEANQSLVTLCSSLHHMIKPSNDLFEIVNHLKPKDYLFIAHEPINSYLSAASHLVFTLIIRILNILKPLNIDESVRKLKFNKIIEDLQSKNILNKKAKITPLHIRRLVDYQVGYKFDFLKLFIPKKYNEGYWSLEDTKTILIKNKMKLIAIKKYPYFTSKYKNINNCLMRIFRIFGLNTQYSLLAQKLDDLND